MKLLERAKNIGLIITMSTMAGGMAFVVHAVVQVESKQDDIITLINDRHIKTLDRISEDTVDKLVAFKDYEAACDKATDMIQTTIYFKGMNIHGCK